MAVFPEAQGKPYVPYTLPGEIVEAEPWSGHPDRGHLLRVDAESAERIAPICPHFGVCGGCALQRWQLPQQERQTNAAS
jgi:23S rRNA (uracil1939-C5)-methyltransferase